MTIDKRVVELLVNAGANHIRVHPDVARNVVKLTLTVPGVSSTWIEFRPNQLDHVIELLKAARAQMKDDAT